MRGNPDQQVELADQLGSIPAHAGQPSRTPRRRPDPRVHPRSRGAICTTWRRRVIICGPSLLARGNRPGLSTPGRPSGPSPLTRGNLHHANLGALLHRSIPAHAGQPTTSAPPTSCARVHPRSRGATRHHSARANNRQGPSPLTRGNLALQRLAAVRVRSIPAHAGQPGGWRSPPGPRRVHPRSRGATLSAALSPCARYGPSPLTGQPAGLCQPKRA